MIRRTIKHRRNTGRVLHGQMPPGTTAICTPTIVATNVQCTFNVPVVVSGIPAATVQGELPTSMVVNSPTQITLHYAEAVVVTNVFVLPPNEPSIRTVNGGYVAAATKTFS